LPRGSSGLDGRFPRRCSWEFAQAGPVQLTARGKAV
jgi:hypothetical protein